MKYICPVCGWTYDEEEGAPEYDVAPGTKFEDLPFEACPLCGFELSGFTKE
ncbi:MAG: rubredoxin [Candidatus Enteromonas sp.]